VVDFTTRGGLMQGLIELALDKEVFLVSGSALAG
jgi:hypothetical protein